MLKVENKGVWIQYIYFDMLKDQPMWNLIIHSNEITIEFSPGSQSIAAEESAEFNPSNYKYTKTLDDMWNWWSRVNV